MRFLAAIVLAIRNLLAPLTIESAIAELDAVIAKVEKAATLHASDAAAHAATASAALASEAVAKSDLERAERVGSKLKDLLG